MADLRGDATATLYPPSGLNSKHEVEDHNDPEMNCASASVDRGGEDIFTRLLKSCDAQGWSRKKRRIHLYGELDSLLQLTDTTPGSAPTLQTHRDLGLVEAVSDHPRSWGQNDSQIEEVPILTHHQHRTATTLGSSSGGLDPVRLIGSIPVEEGEQLNHTAMVAASCGTGVGRATIFDRNRSTKALLPLARREGARQLLKTSITVTGRGGTIQRPQVQPQPLPQFLPQPQRPEQQQRPRHHALSTPDLGNAFTHAHAARVSHTTPAIEQQQVPNAPSIQQRQRQRPREWQEQRQQMQRTAPQQGYDGWVQSLQEILDDGPSDAVNAAVSGLIEQVEGSPLPANKELAGTALHHCSHTHRAHNSASQPQFGTMISEEPVYMSTTKAHGRFPRGAFDMEDKSRASQTSSLAEVTAALLGDSTSLPVGDVPYDIEIRQGSAASRLHVQPDVLNQGRRSPPTAVLSPPPTARQIISEKSSASLFTQSHTYRRMNEEIQQSLWPVETSAMPQEKLIDMAMDNSRDAGVFSAASNSVGTNEPFNGLGDEDQGAEVLGTESGRHRSQRNQGHQRHHRQKQRYTPLLQFDASHTATTQAPAGTIGEGRADDSGSHTGVARTSGVGNGQGLDDLGLDVLYHHQGAPLEKGGSEQRGSSLAPSTDGVDTTSASARLI